MSDIIYRFGPYEFQASNCDLRKHGLRIKLQPIPQQILHALLERAGETVKRQELRVRLWPTDTFVDFDQGLNVAVKKLRDALNESSDAPRYIETVPRIGYRFLVIPEIVRPTYVPAPAAATEERAPEAALDGAHRSDGSNGGTREISPATDSANSRKDVVGAHGQPTGRTKFWVRVFALLAALILAVALISAFAILRPRATTQTLRLNLTLPAQLRLVSTGDGSGLALSPDGTRIVFPAIRPDGKIELWIRNMARLDPEPLPATEAGSFPFWSPDGRSIGFFTEKKLKRLSLNDGVVHEICAVDSGRGGAWTNEDSIVFAPGTRTALYRVSAEGGIPVPVTKLDEKRHTTHRWPALLPDGRHFIFLAASHEAPDLPAEIYLGNLDGSSPQPILETDSNAVVVSDRLLLVSGGKLISRRLDIEHHRADATATILAEGVRYDHGTWYGSFAVGSQSVVYRPQNSPAGQVIAKFDRAGNRLENITKPAIYHTISLSPDGQSLAGTCGDPDIGICLIQRDGAITRLPSTISMGVEWSPDSRTIAYNVHGQSEDEVRIRQVDKDSSEQTIRHLAGVFSWNPDGRHLLVQGEDGIDVLDLVSGEQRNYLPATPGVRHLHARISPDGKWVAYDSEQAGAWDVYLASYPVPSLKYRVSTSGGAGPRWRGDSRELYYIGQGKTLFAVPIVPNGRGLEVAQPRALFRPPILSPPRDRDCCDVNRDGTEFVVVTETRPEDSELVVISHWEQ